jgi:hypothetical protein
MGIKIEIDNCEHGLCSCMAEKIQAKVMPEAHAIGFAEGCLTILEELHLIADGVATLAKAGKDHKPMVSTLIRRLSSSTRENYEAVVGPSKVDLSLAN